MISPSTDGTPWILKAVGDKAKFDMLKIPLQESKTFRLAAAAAAVPACAAFREAAPPVKGTTARRRAKAKAQTAPEALPTDVLNDMNVTRKAWLLDDILNSIAGCVQHCKEGEVNSDLLESCMQSALQFGLTDSIQLSVGKAGKETQKTFKSWSLLRKHLCKELRHAHGGEAQEDEVMQRSSVGACPI